MSTELYTVFEYMSLVKAEETYQNEQMELAHKEATRKAKLKK